MCKPGEPCHDADNKTSTDLMGRIEMMIVLAEIYEGQKVRVPAAVGAMLDVVGPLMMEGLKQAKGWSNVQMAQEIIKQKNKLYEMQGVKAPVNPLEDIIMMFGDILGAIEKKNGTTKDGGTTKPEADEGTSELHVFVFRGGEEDKSA